MRKQYFFLIALGFSSSSFALENLPLSHKGLEKLKMQEIGPDSSKTLSENIETIHGWLQIVWVLFLSLCLIGFMSLPQIIFHSVSPRFHPTNFDSTHSPNDSHRI